MLERVGVRVTTHGKDGVVDRARAAPSRVQVPVVPGERRRRPDRRRRRLPRRLPRRPGLGSAATRAAPQVGLDCSPPTCSRPSGRRSTGSSPSGRLGGSPSAYGDEAAADDRPRTSRGPCRREARRGSGRARSSRRPSRLAVRPARGRAGRGPRRASAPTCGRAPCSRPTAPGCSRWGSAAAARPVGWWSPDPRGVLPLDGLRVTPVAARVARAGSRSASTPPSTRWSRPAPTRPGAGALDHPGDRRRLRPSCTGWAGRTRSSAGARAGSPAACTASPSAACSPGSRCSTARRDASKVALVAPRDAAASPTAIRAGCSTSSGAPTHLASLGVVEVPRAEYLRRLRAALACCRARPAGPPGLRTGAAACGAPEPRDVARDGVPARGATHVTR